MAKKKKNKYIVYSTNPDFNAGTEEEEPDTLPNKEQDLRVWLDRKGGGKVACIVKGYVGSDSDLKALSKELKNLCGVGGTAKNGEILIQGDHRDKIVTYLKEKGYGAKKAGG